MDHPVTDRRHYARFANPRLGTTRVTLRPGWSVVLVDVSAGGALVDVGRPLRPGARVYFQLVTESRTYAIASHVLRCAVSALDPRAGATYRGALKFEHLCELKWEHHILRGFSAAGGTKSGHGDDGKPSTAVAATASGRKSGK